MANTTPFLSIMIIVLNLCYTVELIILYMCWIEINLKTVKYSFKMNHITVIKMWNVLKTLSLLQVFSARRLVRVPHLDHVQQDTSASLGLCPQHLMMEWQGTDVLLVITVLWAPHFHCPVHLATTATARRTQSSLHVCPALLVRSQIRPRWRTNPL